MNGLRFALLVVGILLVIAVGVYSYRAVGGARGMWRRWSGDGRRQRRRVQEPVLAPRTGAPAVEDDGAGGTRPDARIDFVARLPGERPARREVVLRIYREHEYLLEKPHRLYGVDSPSGPWRDVEQAEEGAQYGELQLALQLIDAKGPVNESQLNKFAQVGLRLAEALDRPLKFSATFEEAIERARGLDAFCSSHDLVALVNVMAPDGGGFRGTDIRREAQRLGMRLGRGELFHKLGPGGTERYGMADMHGRRGFPTEGLEAVRTRGLALFMNVPLAGDPPQTFDEMIAAARQLCESLGGRLVDDAERPLDEKGVARIRERLEGIAESMRRYGITPGSATARRLFS